LHGTRKAKPKQQGPQWPADAVKRFAVAKLVPYARNARTHSPAQIAQIAASIREWGFTVPVLIDEAGMIIAGHGRVLAARELGLGEVPVIVARGWSEAQKKAYVIADNKLTENGGWDEALLKVEFADLQAAGFDTLLMGFDEHDVARLTQSNAGLTDPDDAPDLPAVPISRRGEVWLLGRHRLCCGDALSPADVKLLYGGIMPDMAYCDPPYGIGIVKHAGGSIGGAKPFGKVGGGKPHPFAGNKGRVHGPARKAIIKPGMYAPIIGDDSTDTAIGSYRLLAELGVKAIVMWGANYYADKLPASRCWLVWDKENTGSFADAELAWTNQDAIVRLLRHQWSGLIKASERGERRVHPAQKPVALATWAIETVSPKAKTITDLFVGSGSSIIACETNNTTCFAMELAEAYVDVTIKRWQDFTGEKATREADGRRFDDLTGKTHARTKANSDAAQAVARQPGKAKAQRRRDAAAAGARRS
jgi:hypothetical protein